MAWIFLTKLAFQDLSHYLVVFDVYLTLSSLPLHCCSCMKCQATCGYLLYLWLFTGSFFTPISPSYSIFYLTILRQSECPRSSFVQNIHDLQTGKVAATDIRNYIINFCPEDCLSTYCQRWKDALGIVTIQRKSLKLPDQRISCR